MQNNEEVLLRVEHLCQYFPMGHRDLKAVDDVSFDIKKGEVLVSLVSLDVERLLQDVLLSNFMISHLEMYILKGFVLAQVSVLISMLSPKLKANTKKRLHRQMTHQKNSA